MLAVTVIVLVLLALALFSRDWTFGAHGPGIMTKIKILLTHFQVRLSAVQLHMKGKQEQGQMG
jgi:hypothetical protein